MFFCDHFATFFLCKKKNRFAKPWCHGVESCRPIRGCVPNCSSDLTRGNVLFIRHQKHTLWKSRVRFMIKLNKRSLGPSWRLWSWEGWTSADSLSSSPVWLCNSSCLRIEWSVPWEPNTDDIGTTWSGSVAFINELLHTQTSTIWIYTSPV